MFIGGHWVALFLAAFCGLFLVVISYTWVGISNVWSLSHALLEATTTTSNSQSLPICSFQGPSRFQQLCKDSYGQVHTFQPAQAGDPFPELEGIPAKESPTVFQTVYVTVSPSQPLMASMARDQPPPLPVMTTQTTLQTTVQTTLLTVVSQQSSPSAPSSTPTTASGDSSSTAASSVASDAPSITDTAATSTITSTSAASSGDTAIAIVPVFVGTDGGNASTAISLATTSTVTN